MRVSRKLTTEDSELAGTLAEALFSELYRGNMRELLGYALRRCADPNDAADVVAETFLTAWRRLAEVPPGADGRLWLFGTARHVLANHDRSARRRDRLTERLRDELRCHLPAHLAPEAGPFLDALADLPEPDRELLMLIGWEELAPSEAARVLGITPAAARVRLHRARRRLRAGLGERRAPDPHKTETRVEEAR
jgi:RNA polymerase sigma-70 factor (ECF subfamily)